MVEEKNWLRKKFGSGENLVQEKKWFGFGFGFGFGLGWGDWLG